MPTRGVAPTRIANRTIVGPLFTASGFRGWYLACFPDCIAVLPQGWSGFWLAASNFKLPVRGMGSMILNLMYGYGPRLRKKTDAALAVMPDSQLRLHAPIPLSQLRSIAFQPAKFLFASPSIILDRTSGGRREFGINVQEFAKACAQLQEMYPHLCKSVSRKSNV
jgi:uncharacterized protein YjeT (DUF2065 family)